MISGAVHMPAKPDRFEFDGEVAQVFDDMAERSIPGYRDFHAAVRRVAKSRPLGDVWDLGVSTGAGLVAADIGHRLHGVDISGSMLHRARRKVPHADIFAHDLTRGAPAQMMGAQVVVLGWVLQFIESREARRDLLADVSQSLAPGGTVLIGEKFTGCPDMEAAYIRWRISNGYTRAEIDAKTRALRGSMFPWSARDLRSAARDAGLSGSWLYRRYNFGAMRFVRAN